MAFIYAWIVPLWADQLLPQLLKELFDTCLYNVATLNISVKEFIIFVCTDSTEIFFPKLMSAGLNYNLPSFFTDSYCAGISNKHCLLTFSLPYIQTGRNAGCLWGGGGTQIFSYKHMAWTFFWFKILKINFFGGWQKNE